MTDTDASVRFTPIKNIFYWFLLFSNLFCLSSCKEKENKQSGLGLFPYETIGGDQWFFYKYKFDNYPYYPAIDYTDAVRLVHTENKDKVRYITDYFSEKKGAYIDNLNLLNEFKNLQGFAIDNKEKIKFNFNDITELTKLESVYFDLRHDESEIDFSGIENLKQVKKIIVFPCKTKNINNLSKLSELTSLDIDVDNGDISFLKNKINLKLLELRNLNGYNYYNEEDRKKEYYITIDIQVLKEAVSLKEISLYGFTINNIEIINGLNNLEKAVLIDCYLNPSNDFSVISDKIRVIRWDPGDR